MFYSLFILLMLMFPILRDSLGEGQLTDELYHGHRLSEVMIRNRKVAVGGFMPRVTLGKGYLLYPSPAG